jgi:hypothetical protein
MSAERDPVTAGSHRDDSIRPARGWLLALVAASVLPVIAWAVAGGTRAWATRRYVVSKGTEAPAPRLTRCAVHGISYDADKETCPACSTSA